MEIKRNDKGNIEFTPEEFAEFLCGIGNEITAKLHTELAKRIIIKEATNAILKDMNFIEPKLYEEVSERFNPFLVDKQFTRNENLVAKVKI